MTGERIKTDLLEQLKARGATHAHYTSLIDDYMTLWEIKNGLKEDIKERGVAVKWNNGGGQKGVKKNDSIAELMKVNAQMLKILSEMGIRGADIEQVDEDEGL